MLDIKFGNINNKIGSATNIKEIHLNDIDIFHNSSDFWIHFNFLEISFVKISKEYDNEKLKKLIQSKDEKKVEQYLYRLLFSKLDPQVLIDKIKELKEDSYDKGYKDCKEDLKKFIMS